MPFIQMRLILRCYVTASVPPRTARDFKFRFRILKFHRTTHLNFAAKALAQTPPAAELLKFHREILKFSAEAFKPCAVCRRAKFNQTSRSRKIRRTRRAQRTQPTPHNDTRRTKKWAAQIEN